MSDVTRHDFTYFPYGRVIELDREEGKYVLHSDYAALLTRHNALVKAVKEEIAARDHDYFWRCNDATTEDELRENYAELEAARAEVDRLIAADDCKGEG